MAINASIWRAAHFPVSCEANLDLANCGFPAEMLELRLGSLLRLIVFVGSMKEEDRLSRKQRPFAATDLLATTKIGHAAVALLRDWPKSFLEILRRMVSAEPDNSATLNFSEIFGNFYRHLFRVLPRREFGFLHDIFERFVIEDWKGVVRGQHRRLSMATRRNSQWMSSDQAEKIARLNSNRLVDLVRRQQIEGMFLDVGHHIECWVGRESLNQWMTARDLDLARYMSRPEAKRTLGLTHVTVFRVAQAGLIRYINGSERYFPAGVYFLREDVKRIRDAFEKHGVPAQEYSKPGSAIALRHAIKNYLGRDSGLAAVIRSVVDGGLVPVGYIKRFPGITGYLFRSEDLRRYRPVDAEARAGGFLNYNEAASLLAVKHPVIRGLVAEDLLPVPIGYRPGLSKLVPAEDVRCFATRYVATTALAKRFNIDHGSFRRHLKESGTPLLTVPIPGERRQALFVPHEIAAQLYEGSDPHHVYRCQKSDNRERSFCKTISHK